MKQDRQEGVEGERSHLGCAVFMSVAFGGGERCRGKVGVVLGKVNAGLASFQHGLSRLLAAEGVPAASLVMSCIRPLEATCHQVCSVG